MLISIVIIAALYAFLLLNYRFGWDKLNKNVVEPKFIVKVSVVVAMRNEEAEIIRLLKRFREQVYPTDYLQFILVNDHSTDCTLDLLEKHKLDNMLIVNMPEGRFGKKSAIAEAVAIASGEIIISTDADCNFTSNWIAQMVSYFSDEKIKLVSGPVDFNKKPGVFQNLQALEFASLIGSGAGAIGSDSAIFCNGANMAYRKDVFLELNDFANDKAVSGDDVFLLHSVKNKYPKGIAFAKDSGAIVSTDALESLQAFINQRKRWTAKSSSYKDRASIYASFLVLFANLLVVYLFLSSLINIDYLSYFLYYLGIKILFDFYLLYPVLNFFKRRDLIKWILPFELFYSFYIVLIVVLSFTKSFEWKGRIHKK